MVKNMTRSFKEYIEDVNEIAAVFDWFETSVDIIPPMNLGGAKLGENIKIKLQLGNTNVVKEIDVPLAGLEGKDIIINMDSDFINELKQLLDSNEFKDQMGNKVISPSSLDLLKQAQSLKLSSDSTRPELIVSKDQLVPNVQPR